MKRLIKIGLRVLAILVALLLLALIVISLYVKQHEQQFISFLESETEKGLNGAKLHIGDISVGFKSSFPLVALTIDSIYLRDSLWSRHHHNLISANQVYATIDFWKLFHGEIDIKRLDLDKPDIYFYTDSLGYSNTSVFTKKIRSRKDSLTNQPYPIFQISDARFSIDEGVKHKFFSFHIHELTGNIERKKNSSVLAIDLNLDCLVHDLTFNKLKGPFLENKLVQGRFSIIYNRDSRELDFDKIQLAIDQQPFVLTGKFFFGEAGTPFILFWETKNLSFRKAAALLSANIQKRLEPYDIEDPIDSLTGSLDNSETQYSTPLIHLWLKVENRNLKSPFITIDHASFVATYNNESVRFRGHEDSNTVIHFSTFQGNWENLNFHADSVVLSNLIHPRIKMNVMSEFKLDTINKFLKENELAFIRGNGKINLTYSGSLEKFHDSSRLLNGTITLEDAGLHYIPGNILFNPVSGVIRFTDRNMSVENLELHSGHSDLKINGTVKSIFYFFNHLNDQYSFDWNVESNRLNLDDFNSFLQRKTTPVIAENKKSATDSSVSVYISKITSADFNVRLKVNKLIYKKIIADSLQANVTIKNDALQFSNVSMQHVGLSIDEGMNHKLFGLRIHHLDCNIQEKAKSPVLTFDLNLDCLVQSMIFNQRKGSFLENKSLQGAFRILYNKDSRELDFDKILLAVDQQPFVFTGQFFFAKEGTPFLLSWETKNLSFRKAASFLSPNLQKTLGPYDIEDPIASLTGSMDNSEPQYSTPLIHLWLNVENRNVKSPFITVDHASFIATFNNEAVRFRGHEDSNTVIHFTAFQGDWENLHFHADSVVLSDLIHPRAKMKVRSDFKLDLVNSFLKENELTFRGGNGKIDLAYSGSLDKEYDSSRLLIGSITLADADLHYAPRNFRFAPVSGVLRFTGKDMIIENLELHSGSSDLTMNGKLKSIFYLFNHLNDKYTFDWSITSNRLNLDDFNNFLRPQATKAEEEKKKSAPDVTVSSFVSQLTTSNYNISLKANQVIYKKFVVDSLQAAIMLNENEVRFKNVVLKHGKGNMYLNGFMQNDTSSNSFGLETQLNNINVSSLFYVFDNFGLQSMTDKNIHGNLTANISMEGRLTPNAQLIKDGFRSSINFNLKNGQLLNFQPFEQIRQKFLRKRNLSDVRFADLHDSIEVRGENITINRMEIRSSVLTMFVNGMYNMKTGPDMSIQVPLSNLKANKDSVILNKGTQRNQGISVRLRVRRGANGKLDVSWDPFDKANKEMNKNENPDL
ncbi:MAG TPA: AsmA-like C-terminal region-containing protein [Puia sp.]|nr:AsmA-like C-terminal region-containing protein [Puia sp.]